MAIRLKDIASATGVSIVTVSKVLNGDRSIGEETRKRILKCAETLQYRPNLAARGLATGRSGMVGLIVPEIVHGFFSAVAAGISDHLRANGFGLIISSSRDDAELEVQEVRQMMARRVDALIVASCALVPGTFDAIAKELPLVFLDRRPATTSGMGFIGTDDQFAGQLATDHLVGIGCRSIAYIGGPSFNPTRDREAAYRAALRHAGLKVRNDLIVHLPQNEEDTHVMAAEATKRLLKLKRRPDGVFCYNDAAAYGAMAALLEQDFRIPEDVALVGCGNYRYNAFLRVSLTSLDQDTSQLGLQAARMALRMIEPHEETEGLPSEILVQPQLIVRQSSRRD